MRHNTHSCGGDGQGLCGQGLGEYGRSYFFPLEHQNRLLGEWGRGGEIYIQALWQIVSVISVRGAMTGWE